MKISHKSTCLAAAAQRGATRIFSVSLFFCFLAAASFAGSITGTVTNGTTGKPAADVQVILINLQGTMQPVANTKTDSQGHYQLTNDLLGMGPMLLRAVYRGVNYHQPVTPGMTTADVQVFESTDKTSAFAISAHAIILQPNGADLTVGEEFSISNSTNPPVAYYRGGGSFVYKLPAGANSVQVSAGGSSGMPVIQSPIEKGSGESAIDFPFRPGESEVRISYHVPYDGNKTTLHTTSLYDAANVAYFAPPPVQVAADGFAPAGSEQGYSVYLHKSVSANTELVASVSGTAPPPAQTDASSASSTPGGAANSQGALDGSAASAGGAAATAASVTTLPARLDSLKWIVVAGFAAIFALGAVFLTRRPQGAAVAGPVDLGMPVPAASASARIAAAVAPTLAAVPQTVADLDQSVSVSLDALKDALFKLELRRQADTISADDYARERQRIDQKLRELVRG